MVFVFDLDDSICDTDAYSEKYIANFFKSHNLPYKQIAKNVRFAENKFDWPREEALKWYKKFGDQMMLEFPCKEGAVELVNKLYDNGHKIVIATARATDWHTEPEKITCQWLKEHNLKYHKIYIGRIDKELICQEENADVFVDDDLSTTKRVADFFKGTNKKCYLMTTGYNKDFEIDENVKRISCFEELEKHLLKDNPNLFKKDKSVTKDIKE